MVQVKIIVKGLKPRHDSGSGEWITPISGLAIFPDNTEMSKVAHINNKDGVWLSTEEYKALTNGINQIGVEGVINEIMDSGFEFMRELVQKWVERNGSHSLSQVANFQKQGG